MPVIVPHVEKVRTTLGVDTMRALSLVFEKSEGVPPGVPDARFRADHPELMDVLNTLGWSGTFLKQDHTTGSYRVSGYALPLVESPRATQLLKYLAAAYTFMQAYYKEHLRKPFSTRVLIESVGQDRELALEAFFYLRDIDGWWSGLSNDFPLDPNSTVSVNEQVLVYRSFGDLLARVYEWHYINPQKTTNPIADWPNSSEVSSAFGFFSKPSDSSYPEWFNKLDDGKKALLVEIDANLRNELSALPMMGMRALLDAVMVEAIGDVGPFEAKLKRFADNGYVTPQHADILRAVLDAGSASMHRTYFPNAEDLRTCADVVKHLLESIYILKPKVQSLAANTPPRPKAT